MLQVTLTGGPAGWRIDKTQCSHEKSTRIPDELNIVVSVTEPRLLRKILHVTFTGGTCEMEWQQHDGKKATISSPKTTWFEVVMFHEEICVCGFSSCCLTVYVNVHYYQQAVFFSLLFYWKVWRAWWHVACFVKPQAKIILNMKWPMFKGRNVSSILLQNKMHVKMQIHFN